MRITHLFASTFFITCAVSTVFARQKTPGTDIVSLKGEPIGPRQIDQTASSQLMVYWSHTSQSRNISLGRLCREPAVDIIVVTWIRDFDGASGDPEYDFGTGCTHKMNEDSSEISTCGDLAMDITECQNRGKNILLGIGGAASSIVFKTRKSALLAAFRLWELFGDEMSTQPFQNVRIDGFDLDHENGSPAYFEDFAEAIRSFFSMHGNPILISACVSCSSKDPMPQDLFAKLDFISVRFYNANSCNWGSKGFFPSLGTWCDTIKDGKKSRNHKLLVGLLAFQTSGSGYVGPDGVANLVQTVRNRVASCFGGVMLWDGNNGMRTKNEWGDSYITVVKDAMG